MQCSVPTVSIYPARYKLWDSRSGLFISSSWLLCLSLFSLVSTTTSRSKDSELPWVVLVSGWLVVLVLSLTCLVVLLSCPRLSTVRNVSVLLAVGLTGTVLLTSYLLPPLSCLLITSFVFFVQAGLPLLGGLGLLLASSSTILHLIISLYSGPAWYQGRPDLVRFKYQQIAES